jgi:hypothetical protein
MKALLDDRGGLVDSLEHGLYSTPALVPASPWLGDSAPAKPRAWTAVDSITGNTRLRFAPATAHRVWLWAVRARVAGRWTTTILPSEQRVFTLSRAGTPVPDVVIVNEVDRYGIASEDVVVQPGQVVSR